MFGAVSEKGPELRGCVIHKQMFRHIKKLFRQFFYQQLASGVFEVFDSRDSLGRVLGLPDLSLGHGPRHRPLDLSLRLVFGLNLFSQTLLE